LPADRIVLASSAAIAVAFVVWGMVDNKGLAQISSSALDWVIRDPDGASRLQPVWSDPPWP
jgi:choline-glycine betaine transporter